jgi:NitT/TauT family transport system permease protein
MMAPAPKSDARGIALRIAVWAIVIGAWEAAFRIFGWRPWIFPAPSHVLEALVALSGSRTQFALPAALLVSGARLCAGFVISVVIGTLLGTAMWRVRWLDDLLGGFLLGLQTLPSVCWVPLSILIFGLNEKGIAFVLVMGSAFAVAIAFRDGLRTIPPIYRKAGLMLGARGLDLYRYVILPASMPALASSLRQGFSFAWRSLMGAELIFMVNGHGVGYLLHQGREFSDVAQVVGVMIVMILIGMAFDRSAFAPLERNVHRKFGLSDARG